MPGRLGIDFGTSNTVVAVWDDVRKEGVPLHIPDYGRQIQYRRSQHATETISVVPQSARPIALPRSLRAPDDVVTTLPAFGKNARPASSRLSAWSFHGRTFAAAFLMWLTCSA